MNSYWSSAVSGSYHLIQPDDHIQTYEITEPKYEADAELNE